MAEPGGDDKGKVIRDASTKGTRSVFRENPCGSRVNPRSKSSCQ
jgi:hypothetical protein